MKKNLFFKNLKAENLLNGSKWISSKSEDTKEYVIIQVFLIYLLIIN